MLALAQSGCGFLDFLNFHSHLLSSFLKELIRWFLPRLFIFLCKQRTGLLNETGIPAAISFSMAQFSFFMKELFRATF